MRDLEDARDFIGKQKQVPHPPGEGGGFGMTWLVVILIYFLFYLFPVAFILSAFIF